MEKLLKIYTYVDGVNDTPFPNADAQIEIFSFNYDAKRMGGAPTISASVMYKDCLDKLWTGKEYVIYNGERYKLKQTPTSSKTNTDARYKHDLEMVALRVVLDHVYFFDAVVENTPVDDKPVTNSTKVVFSGDIHEFAKRLNASLKYTKLDYSVVVDEGITSETKFLSFDAQPISSVLQEIYKQYEIPYYFVGNVIHIGFTSNAITETFKYGYNDALLSISKNNANNKIVNRCTGVGSSENIPYYYPNEHPLGKVNALYNNESNDALKIQNPEAYGNNVKLATTLTYTKTETSEFLPTNQWYPYSKFKSGEKERHSDNIRLDEWWESPEWAKQLKFGSEKYLESLRAAYGDYESFNSLTETELINGKYPGIAVRVYLSKEEYGENTTIKLPYEVTAIIGQNDDAKEYEAQWDVKYYYRRHVLFGGAQQIDGVNGFKLSSLKYASDEYVYAVFTLTNPPSKNESIGVKIDVKVNISPAKVSYDWKDENGTIKQLSFYGLSYNGTPNIGDTITFEQVKGSLIPYQDALMPPVYWETKGAESFYNALNDTYISPETGEYYSFENEYSDENRREHKETFDYIKPSIEFVKNGDNKPINMFLEFAYDENDSDEIGEDGNYLHPYFFAKLRKFNGENGFNLFDHANEKGEMTISMTSGNCGACNFVIGVQEDTQKNIVQVNDDGTLARDDNGNVKFGAPQDRQNDTINNEVWIALKKDASTFPDIMPNATYNYKPKACTDANTDDGDTFVITNISLPTSYIREAEERLKEEIIKYMKLNNSEKFTFSIKFSRIYLAENPNILAQLNENARIQIEYNSILYELYVSSYQYKVVNNDVLPEITVELAGSLSTNENALQQAISAVEHSIMLSISSIDFYKQGLEYFIRKEGEDWARGLLHLTKGATFGANDISKIDEQGNAEFVSQIIRQFISTPLFIDGFAGQGFKLWLDENGKSNLTVDNLTARETFRVFELLVTKLRAVNGGLFVSAANGTIKSVSESEDGLYYDILLENENTFIAGDYMRCQVMSGVDITSYWVEISEVFGNTCRVAKTEFGFSLPSAGQDAVLCGSKNIGRQNAIHISASDDGQPRIDILNGISTKSLDGCLRTRLGNLDGIVDEYFGENQPKGDGLYSDNAYLRGEFVLKSKGQSVDTLFAIQDGKILSSIKTTQSNPNKNTLLSNYSFADGLNGWITENESSPYIIGDNAALLIDNNNILAQQGNRTVTSEIENSQTYARIIDSFIKQSNIMFADSIELEGAYNRVVDVKFDFKYRCISAGYIIAFMDNVNYDSGDATAFKGVADTTYGYDTDFSVALPNGDEYVFTEIDEVINEGDIILVVDLEPVRLINITRKVEVGYSECSSFNSNLRIETPIFFIGCKYYIPNNTFISDSFSAKWNGTGDFNLVFGGEILLHSLQLYSDVTEVKYATFFEQTDKFLNLGAENFNDDGSVKNSSGIMVKPEGTEIYVWDAKNKTHIVLGEFAVDSEGNTKIKLSGDKIMLEGNVTANNKVQISPDGLLIAENATLTNAEITNATLTNAEINGHVNTLNENSKVYISLEKKLISTANNTITDTGYDQLIMRSKNTDDSWYSLLTISATEGDLVDDGVISRYPYFWLTSRLQDEGSEEYLLKIDPVSIRFGVFDMIAEVINMELKKDSIHFYNGNNSKDIAINAEGVSYTDLDGIIYTRTWEEILAI